MAKNGNQTLKGITGIIIREL